MHIVMTASNHWGLPLIFPWMLNKLYSLHNSILIATIFKKTAWLRNRDGEVKIWEEMAHPYPQVKIHHPTECHTKVHTCLYELYIDH